MSSGHGPDPSARVAIVGDGLIGRSIRLGLGRADAAADVVSLDRGDDLGAVRGAGTVLLAAPVDAIAALMPEIAARARGAALVMDAGSTKRAIIQAAKAAGVPNFVGGHPMAGGTSTGPAAARADLFDRRTWFLVTGLAPPAAVSRARTLVASLGASPVEMPDDGTEHDQLVAAISHLPQVVASALLARVGEAVGADGISRSGAGLRDTTRIAASAPDVWRGILATNADAVAPLLRAMAADLAEFADKLDDPAAIEHLFARAHRWIT